VVAEVEAISSAFANSSEYAARIRNDPLFVGDLYNAFPCARRRLGRSAVLDQPAREPQQTRETERRDFIASTEFQARVNAILAAPCIRRLDRMKAPHLRARCAPSAALVLSQAQAQDAYPSKPVRIVVPYPAAASRISCRAPSGRSSPRSGSSPWWIENKPGASGNIGMAEAHAPSPTATRWCWRPPATSP
jgi:hypothetical protein